MRLAIGLLLLALAPARSLAAAPELPGDSVYQLRLALVDQAGEPLTLDVDRGRPVLLAMFYASCPSVCPTLLATLKRLDQDLGEHERRDLRILLVTIDPEKDTPEALAALAARHRMDLTRWRLARAAGPDVRALAAVLGVAYRKLPDGSFNHSTTITLLDREGRIAAQSARIGAPDAEFAAKVRRLLATSTPAGDAGHP